MHTVKTSATVAEWDVHKRSEDARKLVGSYQENEYPIREPLYSKYDGSGYAIAALLGGELVDLRYLRDIDPAFSDLEVNFNGADIAETTNGPAFLRAVRQMQALGGKVLLGRCGGMKFMA
jgi:hypothetical protein